MKNVLKILLPMGAIVCILTTSGCVPLIAGAAAGAGGMLYVKGNLEQNVDYSVVKVHKASLASLKGQKVFVTSDELNKHSAVIKGEYGDGKKVTVLIESLTERASTIKVRVGVIGDQEKSQKIMDGVLKKL